MRRVTSFDFSVLAESEMLSDKYKFRQRILCLIYGCVEQEF